MQVAAAVRYNVMLRRRHHAELWRHFDEQYVRGTAGRGRAKLLWDYLFVQLDNNMREIQRNLPKNNEKRTVDV